MTRDVASWLLPYLKAYADGKIVKGKRRCTDPFETLDEHSHWEEFCELKIEAPPREFFLLLDNDGRATLVSTKAFALGSFEEGEAIKVREVKDPT